MSTSTRQENELQPLPASVAAITGTLTSEDLERTERLTRMQDDSWVVHEVIQVWRQESESERGLRRMYATAMLIALCVETAFASLMFLLIGLSVLQTSTWVANVFFATVFGQVATGALAITKYLFPADRTDALLDRLVQVRTPRPPKRRKAGGS